MITCDSILYLYYNLGNLLHVPVFFNCPRMTMETSDLMRVSGNRKGEEINCHMSIVVFSDTAIISMTMDVSVSHRES